MMTHKLKSCSLLVMFAIIFSQSCKKDDVADHSQIEDQKVGRFDNEPFKWDYQSNPSSNKLFIGDLTLGKYTNNATPNSKNVKAATNSIFIGSNSNIYPGGVYPLISIQNNTFSDEYPYEKSPFDYYFGFSRKFTIQNIVQAYGKGLFAYHNAENEALNSQQFKDYVRSTESRAVEFSSVEALTYSDIEKNFSGNVAFGKLFTSKMSDNRKNLRYKSLYFARLESSIFEVIFEPDYRNFFSDPLVTADLKNSTYSSRGAASQSSSYFKKGNPIYVRNMSYGNYAYLAIESEYSFSDVKKAIEGTFNLWKIGIGAKYDQKTVEILSKSSVTIMISGKAKNNSNVNETYWGTSIDLLKDIFTVNYNENYIGTPTFVELRYASSNALYTPQPYQLERNPDRERDRDLPSRTYDQDKRVPSDRNHKDSPRRPSDRRPQRDERVPSKRIYRDSPR